MLIQIIISDGADVIADAAFAAAAVATAAVSIPLLRSSCGSVILRAEHIQRTNLIFEGIKDAPNSRQPTIVISSVLCTQRKQQNKNNSNFPACTLCILLKSCKEFFGSVFLSARQFCFASTQPRF